MRSQDNGSDDGMGSYHLVDGWGASYPETTGYIIPTLIAAGEHLEWHEPNDRAIRAAEWLLTIQRPDGGWQGGRIGEDRPSIVFNTAQVLRGLLAAHALSKREEFLHAAVRGAGWITSVQGTDGAWRMHNFLGAARVYDAYVDAPLLMIHAITGDELYKRAAQRNLAWVLTQQFANGWFANCDNTIVHNDRPITHTIAYTIDGLLQCGIQLKEEPLESYWDIGSRGGRNRGQPLNIQYFLDDRVVPDEKNSLLQYSNPPQAWSKSSASRQRSRRMHPLESRAKDLGFSRGRQRKS